MSDAPTPAPEPIPDAVIQAEPAAATPPVEVDPDVDGDELPEGQMVFDRGYVEKLRKENQRYRTERNEANDKLKDYAIFDQYEPEDRDAWLGLVSGWANDPAQVAPVFQQIAASVLGDGSDPGGDVAAAQSIEDSMTDLGDAELTPDKVNAMIESAMSARDQAGAERAAVEGIYTEMREAGVDPQSREGMAVLWSANHETDGDIAKAIESVKADRQKIIDDYVKGASSGGATVAPTSNGVVASQDQPIQNLDDARRAADAYIRAQVGAPSGNS